MAYTDQSLLLAYRDIILGLIIIFGYMLTDTAHYGLFKLPRYRTVPESYLFIATADCGRSPVVKWCLLLSDCGRIAVSSPAERVLFGLWNSGSDLMTPPFHRELSQGSCKGSVDRR